MSRYLFYSFGHLLHVDHDVIQYLINTNSNTIYNKYKQITDTDSRFNLIWQKSETQRNFIFSSEVTWSTKSMNSWITDRARSAINFHIFIYQAHGDVFSVLHSSFGVSCVYFRVTSLPGQSPRRQVRRIVRRDYFDSDTAGERRNVVTSVSRTRHVRSPFSRSRAGLDAETDESNVSAASLLKPRTPRAVAAEDYLTDGNIHARKLISEASSRVWQSGVR